MGSGFEVIVRPAVFPNIRPNPARVLPPEDDPTKGMVVMAGGGASSTALTYSYSISVQKQPTKVEEKRQVDKEKVKQVDKNGNINEKNFVEIERLKKVKFKEDEDDENVDQATRFKYADPPERKNVETKESNVTRENPLAHVQH